MRDLQLFLPAQSRKAVINEEVGKIHINFKQICPLQGQTLQVNLSFSKQYLPIRTKWMVAICI